MKKIILLALISLATFKSWAQLPFTQTTVLNGLNQPVAFAIAPDDGRFFVTLKTGQIMVYSSTGNAIGTFYDLSDSVITNFERGLLGICLDPDYVTNHYVYAYYNHRWPNTANGNQYIRVIRFTDMNNVGDTPRVLLNIPVAFNIPGNHVGGNIRFRPSDQTLFVSIGDIGTSINSQLLINPFGKILRINKDGSIPSNNPFYDDGNPAFGFDDRIWEYGHRNPFDFNFSPNDSLYISENGASTFDEFNLGRRGGNFGWPICEGNCGILGLVDPLTTWAAPLPAVTGILFYNGCMFPEYRNHVIVADNDNGQIYDCTMGNSPAYNTVTSNTLITDLTTSGGLTTLAQGPNGEIYAMNGGYTANGGIFKLSRTINAAITAGGPTTFCNPGNVLLSATPANYYYQWYTANGIINGATNSTYAGNMTTTYTVSICNNVSNGIAVISKPRPNATVTPADTQYYCPPATVTLSANIGSGLLYQWYRNNTALSGSTASTFVPGNTGKYRVLVTRSNGCTRYSNRVQVYKITCRNEENETLGSHLTVYPNPSDNEFIIDLGIEDEFNVSIIDLQGKILFQTENINGEIIIGNELQTGVYLLETIDSKGNRAIQKIIKSN